VTSAGAERQCLEGLIQDHLRRYPGFGPEDLAKLLYQGVMGMDHLLGDRERFLKELWREWESLEPVSLTGEVPLERIHPSGPTARLNLRPLKAAGVALAEIGPLLADQPSQKGELAELRRLWDEVLALAHSGRMPFTSGELCPLSEAILAGGHLPGHSIRYRELNRPAYRLVHDVTDPAMRGVLARAGLASDLS